MDNEKNQDKEKRHDIENNDDIEKVVIEQHELQDDNDDMVELEIPQKNYQQDETMEDEYEQDDNEILEDEVIDDVDEIKEEDYEDISEQDDEIGFDYMSYMSIPRYAAYEDDTKDVNEKIEKLQDEPQNKEYGSKAQRDSTKKIVLTSTLVSILASVVICIIFAAMFIFAWPHIKDFNKVYDQPAFKTYKNITIEAKSNELIAEVAEKVGPSVVGIKATILTRDYFFGITESNPEGSGIVFRENGYILTNNHVIESALLNNTNTIANGCKIEVILPSPSNKTYEAKVIGRDTKTDLAVLKIEETGLETAEFGNSDNIRVGQTAIAIGNPGGLEYMGSVTSGIISGLNRTVDLGNGKQLKLVQTDAAINPGNSGGALVNSKGEVIGVNTVKIAGSNYEGLGFAIPSNTVKEVVESLVEFKYVKGRPLLGIKVDTRYTESVAKQYRMPIGVYVASVDLLSAAEQAGIEKGDVITEFDGVKIKNIDELNEQKNKHVAGDEVDVKLYKATTGRTKTVKMKLGEDIGTIS